MLRPRLPGLAHIHPLPAGHPLQLVQMQLHGIVGRARGRVHRIKRPQALVQIHPHPLRQRKGTDAPLRMPDQLLPKS